MFECSRQDAKIATLLASVGHPLRLKIIEAMGNSPVRMADIADRLGTENAPQLWVHVKKMVDMGIVKKSRSGKLIYYSLVDQGVSELVVLSRQIYSVIQGHC